MVAGWFGATRRACSRGWRSDWPFSGAVGNHRTAIPANRTSGAGGLSDKDEVIGWGSLSQGLNAPSGAGAFLLEFGDKAIAKAMRS